MNGLERSGKERKFLLTKKGGSFTPLVLAYTRSSKGPRIIERGTRGTGGYVVLWFDDPEAFRGRWGGTRPEVEQTRANVEEHVFKWPRDLMRSRFGGRVAADRTATTTGQ